MGTRRDTFFSTDADFVSPPEPLPPVSPYSPYHQQPQYAPNLDSSPSPYQYEHQPPASPAGPIYPTPATAYYSTPNEPSPGLSQSPSFADKYAPAGSDLSILSPSGSDASIKKKKPFCTFPCCGFRSARTLFGCCTCLLFLVLALLAAVLFLAKAPEISFQSVEPPSNGLAPFSVNGPNFTMNFNLKIAINNPNIIGVTVSKVMGEAKFPVSDNVIGYGNVTDLSIPYQSNQVVLFPFQINYDPSIDPDGKILRYVAEQCGLLGGPNGKLEINYNIKLSFGVLATLGIVPSFPGTASIDCPIDGSTTLRYLAALSTPSAAGKRRRSLRSPIEVEISPSEESSE